MEKSPNSSPEFEFWMSSNNNHPPSSSFSHTDQNLLSADELFSDGVILPLNTHPPPPRADPTTTNPQPPPAPPSISSSPKRWKLMFRKEAKRTNGASSANNMELNIHIWPFSRSRSAGNTASSSSSSTGSTLKPPPPGRKSCSAPCSRSNSRGDSETATSSTSSATKPAGGTATAALKKRGQLAGGIYIGRSVPLWHLRPKNHGNNNNNNGRGVKKINGGLNMLNLKNVNTCIGYGSNNVSGCRVEDKDEATEGDRSHGDVIRGGNLLKFRAIFSKKVHV